MDSLRNIRLTIAFDGTQFNGWQRQKHDITIQGEIERCLGRMTTTEVNLHGAGRTDAGVHADEMTAHFMTHSAITASAFKRGLNSMLPGAIRIIEAAEADIEFHSRFSAKGKHYEYTIYTGEVMPPTTRLYALHVPQPLDFKNIDACLNTLVGRYDFSSFENAGSRDKDKNSRKGAIRTITTAHRQCPDSTTCIFTFVGEGFLRHMVRNLVGTLLEVGKGQRTTQQFSEALIAADRSSGGPTAPPHGLRLVKVLY